MGSERFLALEFRVRGLGHHPRQLGEMYTEFHAGFMVFQV